MPTTPCGLVRAAGPVHRATKRELVQLSRELERAALDGSPPAVAAALQDARFLTDRTRGVYASLAAAGAGADADRAFTVGVSRDPVVVASCGRLLGI